MKLVDIKTGKTLRKQQLVTTIRDERVTLFSWREPTGNETMGYVQIIDTYGKPHEVSPLTIGAQFI